MANNFVRRAIWLLNNPTEENENKIHDTIFLRAIEGAIPKAIIIAEVVRRRVAGLYQINTIGSAEISEVYRPLEEGLVEVKITKKLSNLIIKLTKTPSEKDRTAAGF